MEVSALRYSGGVGLQARPALLRLQSDERLISVVRRGNPVAFEVLVSRYQSRLLAFCRHLLGSREDAEDVLQEVLAAAFNAILADDRPINVRPWLYRIARNRCLNHLRRIQAVGVDSMDVHLSEHGASTADKVHKLEEFRMLVGDIQELPETQKTALVLREMDALSYEQIAEAMETTVPSVKSLLVRARMSLAEAAEARMLSCEEVRMELAEVAEGLQRRATPLVRRHLRACKRCSMFQVQLKETNKALTALFPIGPFVLLKKLALTHLGHSASAGAGSGASGASAAGQAAALSTTAAAGAAVGPTAGGLISVGAATIATKAAAGLAAAALVTAGAVEVSHSSHASVSHAVAQATPLYHTTVQLAAAPRHAAVPVSPVHHLARTHHATKPAKTSKAATTTTPAKSVHHGKAALTGKEALAGKTADPNEAKKITVAPGRTQSQTQTTVLATPPSSTTTSSPPTATDESTSTTTTSTTSTSTTSTSTTPTSTTPTSTAPTSTTPTSTIDPGSTTTSSSTTPAPSGTIAVGSQGGNGTFAAEGPGSGSSAG